MKDARHTQLSFGFSLVEVLVVVAIIAILMSLAVPTLTSVRSGQDIASGGELVAGTLNLARQLAITENHRTEVRFWKLPADGRGEQYRAIQVFRVDDGTPLEPLRRLPPNVIVREDTRFSTLVMAQNDRGGDGKVGPNENVPYKAVEFRPDGSTHLSPDAPASGSNAWTVSLVNENSEVEIGRPAVNFSTVALDPVTGRATIYRP